MAFSEGAVGGFFLHANGTGGDIQSLDAVKAFIEGKLKRPLVVREMSDSISAPGRGSEMIRELFERILAGQSDSEAAG
jgi:hypothetical protein